ncbi:MAG: MYG1 family protein [Candidatus Paceibacterota bacterium]|jgi:uncharacterized UPF0160 family protein
MFFKKKIVIATHNGAFHPDDVFAVALLSILHKGNIKVVRTRDEKIISKADFVLDIGFEHEPSKNRFDHHQEGGAGKRENGISYSTFGILWKEYGEKVCGSKRIADILDNKLVEVIDADDCGVSLYKSVIDGLYPFTITDAIYSMYPTWKEEDIDINKVFLKAVDFAREVLSREIKDLQDKIEAENIVEEIYKNSEDKRIIIFDKYLPKSLLLNYPEPLFSVYKEKDGLRWRVTTIRKFENSFESRKNFSESWWGKSKEDLVKITGISDVTFCRNGGIYAGADTKEGAIKLAKLAVEA